MSVPELVEDLEHQDPFHLIFIYKEGQCKIQAQNSADAYSFYLINAEAESYYSSLIKDESSICQIEQSKIFDGRCEYLRDIKDVNMIIDYLKT